MGRRRKLPAEPFRIEIESLAENGRGTGIHEQSTLEVFDALPGETVDAKYLFGRRFRGQAQTVNVLRASSQRVQPRCPHFGTCSACTLQHLEPSAQIRAKQEWLLQRLQAVGNLVPDRVLPPLQADIWHYRRKARLSVRDVKGKGRVLVGFRERDGRFVADMQECHVLPEVIAKRLPALSTLIGSLDGAGVIPQIEVTCGDTACVLTVRHLEPLSEADVEKIGRFAQGEGLDILLQGGGPQSVRRLAASDPDLRYSLPEFGLEYRFAPQDFVQVNAAMNGLMIRQALDLLETEPADAVLELFCGLGNFSLPLARHCSSVTAVEGDASLVERARSNAERNDVDNARFIEADLYRDDHIGALPGGPYDKILLDPPRSGAGQLLGLISETGARRVVYVSCNPVTLAEDCARLVREHGFELAAAGVMDMFPHTTHVESMALLTRA